jgi:hypothetical protein
MATPSNRTGIATLPMVVLVVVILFLGFVVAPRAFEFRAWPQPSRHDAIEAVVERPAPEAIEVRVARVNPRASTHGVLAVRGTNHRAGSASAARVDRTSAVVAGRGPSRGRPGRRAHAAAPSLAAAPAPTAAPQAPAAAPDKPAQLAGVPSSGPPVLRPDAGSLPAADVPAPLGHERPRWSGDSSGSGSSDN